MVGSLDPQPPTEIVGSLEMALDFAEQHVVDALVIGPTLVGDLAFELASYLYEANKGATIVVPQTLDTETLRAAMRSQVVDVVEYREARCGDARRDRVGQRRPAAGCTRSRAA